MYMKRGGGGGDQREEKGNCILMDSDWSELPEDLLSQIILNLNSSSSSSSSALDCIRLGAVCVEWRSFLFRNVKFPIPFPMLLIPPPPPTTITTTTTTITTTTQDQNQTTTPAQEMKMNHNNITTKTTTTTTVTKSRGSSFCFNISDRKFYYSPARLLSDRYLCHGSTSQGWLVTLDPYEDFSIRLYYINPFNSSSSSSSINNNNNLIIDIPRLSTSCQLVYSDISCWRKIVLSSSPSLMMNLQQPNNFVAMLLVEINKGRSGLFTYSVQDRVWNTVLKSPGGFSINDVIYFRQQFHVVFYTGHLYICDKLHPEQYSAVLAPPTEIMINQESKKYLVESSEGDLLQVQRNYNPMLPRFQVFKLVLEEEQKDVKLYSWVEIKTLNGCMLFLSENASMSFSASDLIGYKSNCIYFSDHKTERSCCLPLREQHPIIPLGVGVFNLEDGIIEQHLPPPTELSDDTNSTSPIWIQTMLYMNRQ